MKSENFASLEIFKLLIETLSFKSSRILSIPGLLLLQALIRLSLFNSIPDLNQFEAPEINNLFKINLIFFLTICEMTSPRILTAIKAMAEAMIKSMIKNMIKIKIKARVKTSMKMTMSQIQIIINVLKKSTASSIMMKIILCKTVLIFKTSETSKINTHRQELSFVMSAATKIIYHETVLIFKIFKNSARICKRISQIQTLKSSSETLPVLLTLLINNEMILLPAKKQQKI